MHLVKRSFFFFAIPSIVYLTCFFIAGIILQSTVYAPILFNIYTASFAVILFFTLYTINYFYASLLGFYVLFISLGAWSYAYQINKQQVFYTIMSGQEATIAGSITALDHDTNYPQKTTICLSAQSILTKSLDRSCNALVPVSLQVYTTLYTDLEIGDIILLENIRVANKPSEDFARYLMREHLDGTLFIKKEQIKRLDRPSYSLSRWLGRVKKNCFAALQKKMSPQTFAFFSSLFWGNKKTNKKEMNSIKNNFKAWGISHYLARSGLHMIIFIGVWQLLLMFFPLGYVYKELLLMLLALSYCLFTLPSISFNRAVLAFLLYKFYTLIGRQSHALTTISLVTLVLLFYNPISLFFLDFQLSFGLAFLLAWLNQLTIQKRINPA